MKKNILILILSLLPLLAFSFFCSGTEERKDSPDVRLNINRLEAEGPEKEIASKINMILYTELKGLKGEDKIILREKTGIEKSSNRQLAGRVIELEGKYIITVKVIEGEKGSLLFNRTVSTGREGIESKIKEIAGEIARDKKVWGGV